MAKKPSGETFADRSIRTLDPTQFTYPDAAEGEKPKGKPSWGSVRARQSGGSVTLTPEQLSQTVEAAMKAAREEGEEDASFKLGGK